MATVRNDRSARRRVLRADSSPEERPTTWMIHAGYRSHRGGSNIARGKSNSFDARSVFADARVCVLS